MSATLGLDERAATALAKPPADGVLLWYVDKPAKAAGFEPGDVLLSLNGVPTTTQEHFDRAFRLKAAGPVPNVVARRGNELTIDADRFIAYRCGPLIGVAKGEAVELRPEATVASLDLSLVRAEPVSLTADHVSNAFGNTTGKNRKGHRTWTLHKDKRRLVFTVTSSFKEFGDHEFVVTGETDSAGRVSTTVWADTLVSATVQAARRADVLTFTCTDVSGTPVHQTVAVPADCIPSTLVPILATLLPREEGASFRYTPVSEDAFPWWLPERGKRSWFALEMMRCGFTVVCRELGKVRIGRHQVPAWRYDHVALGRTWAKTWLTPEGEFLVHDRLATSFVANPLPG
jgi:hypothetical protein